MENDNNEIKEAIGVSELITKIDWKRKLTSRKFWTSVASFTAMMIVACGGTESTATQITALIMAGASVVAYIVGEGLADAANVFEQTTTDEND